MAHDVFISYSSEDKLAADALCAALEAARIRCWMAPRNVVPALSYSGQITRAIKASRVMVLIFSEHANVSAAVLAEVELAANARVHILNFRVDASPLGDDLLFYLQHRHWLDALTPPMELHHARLVQSILGLLALASSAEETQLTTATKHPATSTPALSALVPGEAGGAQPRKFTMFRVLLLVALGMGAITAILIWIAGRSSAPQPAPTFAPKPIAATTPLATPESSPRTLLVPGTYSKIQAAIDAARSGDTVKVAAGTYTGKLEFKDGINLIGAGMDQTLVRCGAAEGDLFTVRSCSAGVISDMGFEHTGENKTTNDYDLVWLDASAVKLLRCRIRHSGHVGIFCTAGDQSVVQDCEVSGCGFSGIIVRSGAKTTLLHNRCENNTDVGIGADGADTSPTLTRNEARGNTWAGIIFQKGAGGTAEANLCENNGEAGIQVTGEGTAPTLTRNEARGNTLSGIVFAGSAGGTAEANLCENNKESGIAALDLDTAPTLRDNRGEKNGVCGIFVGKGAKPIIEPGNNLAGRKFRGVYRER
ncbi:MAG: hypothetical protein DME87_11940 [Verrucomicrobia bacterium]|nr:MAG: hypothetical protein DME87_11940 [Verrucomicrobiota bacterium]